MPWTLPLTTVTDQYQYFSCPGTEYVTLQAFGNGIDIGYGRAEGGTGVGSASYPPNDDYLALQSAALPRRCDEIRFRNHVPGRVAQLQITAQGFRDLPSGNPLAGSFSNNFITIDANGNISVSFLNIIGPLGAVLAPQPSGDTTGATDTAGIQALIISNSLLLLWPGTYYITSLLWNSLTGVGLQGAGKAATTLMIVGSNHIGLDFTSNAGTGGIQQIYIADLAVKSQSNGNNTALQLWNADQVNCERCSFSSDYLALNYQGSFNASFQDCDFYIQNSNAAPLACIWTGSGKTAPFVGAVTLSGAGAVTFIDCLVESFNKAPAVLVDENTYTIEFDTCQFTAEGGTWHGMIQLEGGTLCATFNNCYQEAAHNDAFNGVDFAIANHLGNAGQVNITNYSSTGSAGQQYAIDVTWANRLNIKNINCIVYSAGVINFDGLPVGTDDRQYTIENVDNSGDTLVPLYNCTDLSIAPTYRGDIHRTNKWTTIRTGYLLITAANATGPSSFIANPFVMAPPQNAGTDPFSGMGFFEYDPNDYEYSRVRVRTLIQTNNVASGVNTNVGLVPSVGNPSGAAGNIHRGNGAFIVDTAAINDPATTEDVAISPTSILTTAGSYALAASIAGAYAAGSVVALQIDLQVLE